MTKTARLSRILALALLFLLASAMANLSNAATGENRDSSKNPIPGKDAEACRLENRPHAVIVKFNDGLKIRLRKGELVDLDGRALSSRRVRDILARLDGGVWIRNHFVDEDSLDRLRMQATRRSGQRAPDLNLYYTLGLPERFCISDAIQLLSQIEEVHFVYPFPKYELALDFYAQPRGFHDVQGEQFELPWQKYLSGEADGGIDAYYAHSRPGGKGSGVNVLDVEFAFYPPHFELHGNVVHDFDQDFLESLEQRNIDHGTATLGVVAANEARPGIVGIAPRAKKHFAPVIGGAAALTLPSLVASYCQQIPDHVYCANVEGVLVYELAGGALRRGDVVLLELQMAGPNATDDWGFDNQLGGVPVEWNPAVFDAIRTLHYLGIVVVQAAGNGSQDLDALVYQAGDHRPFLVENGVRINDSGAIIVGAASSGTDWATGTFLPGPNTPRAPTGVPREFSNFGQRVDVHAWGDGVVTSGYGDLYGGGDLPILAYTGNYSGTSSASAIVAGAATSLQGAYKHLAENAVTGGYGFRSTLWSPTLRNLLKRTGTAKRLLADLDPETQQGLTLSAAHNVDPNANIGTRPNLRRAIDSFQVQDEDFCQGQSVPTPTLSAEGGPVVLHNNSLRVELNYGDPLPYGPDAGGFDIVFTTDGSEPDCVPRLGNCDLSRVGSISQASAWRFDPVLSFQASALPLTIRARTAAVWPSCGTRWSQEISATYEIN